MSKEEVSVVAEVSGELTAEAPTVIFYSAYHIVGHMHAPPPTQDRCKYCIILPSDFIELTKLFSKEKMNAIYPHLQSTIELLSFNVC